MLIKNLKYLGLAGLALVGQWMFQPVISLGGIGPNFLIILIIAVGLEYGAIIALWAAFVLGLLIDSLTAANLFGLSSFSLAITAYLAAQFKGHLNRFAPIFQYLILLLVVFVFYLENDFIYHQGLNWRFLTLLWSHIIPATLYTFIALFFLFSVTHFGED